MSKAVDVHLWLRALLTLAVLMASPRAFGHAELSGHENDANQIASRSPSGPPRPAQPASGGPWRAQLASTPGRASSTNVGAAPRPLWMYDASLSSSVYFELDIIGNVRRLRGGKALPTAPPLASDLGGYRYTAFGHLNTTDTATAYPSAQGARYDQPLRWQSRWFIDAGSGFYDFRARVWSPELAAFLQPDEYGFLSQSGTLWSWPGQNPFRWRDPSGRDAAEDLAGKILNEFAEFSPTAGGAANDNAIPPEVAPEAETPLGVAAAAAVASLGIFADQVQGLAQGAAPLERTHQVSSGSSVVSSGFLLVVEAVVLGPVTAAA